MELTNHHSIERFAAASGPARDRLGALAASTLHHLNLLRLRATGQHYSAKYGMAAMTPTDWAKIKANPHRARNKRQDFGL